MNGPPRNTILFVYGDGGNGKSLLLQYLQENYCKLLAPTEWARAQTMSDSEFREAFGRATVKVPSALLNFNPPPRSKKDPRDPFNALTALRRGLSGHNLKFPAFDFACRMYLDKVGELTPEREREVFPAEEMDFLAEFAEGLLKFKYVGLVNLFFKLGGKHLGREFKLWLKRRRLTKEQLGRIQEMDETELLSTLPVVFAKDLSACVPISKTQRIILLFDSHEVFWGVEQRIYFPEERRQEFDDWFRALLKTLNRSRGIVVVVAGRDEPLHWPNAFDRWKIGKVEVDLQQVEGLSVEDSRDYLLRVGITDALLCDTLLQYAQLTPGSVHPLFLHLCTEVIRNASAEGVHLTPSDFQQSVALVEKRVQLVRSLFKYLLNLA